MAILYYLPDAETLITDKNIRVLSAPTRLYDIEINDSFITGDYIRKCFYEVGVVMAPVCPRKIDNYMQAQ